MPEIISLPLVHLHPGMRNRNLIRALGAELKQHLDCRILTVELVLSLPLLPLGVLHVLLSHTVLRKRSLIIELVPRSLRELFTVPRAPPLLRTFIIRHMDLNLRVPAIRRTALHQSNARQ